MKTIAIIAAAAAMTVAAAPAFAQPEGQFGNAKVSYEKTYGPPRLQGGF